MNISSGGGRGRNGSRRLNFELNLVPFIDVLSTSICFLLLTAVFLQLGTVNVRQAIGDSSAVSAKDVAPTVWLKLGDDGQIGVSVKNVKASRASEFTVAGRNRQPDLGRFGQSLAVVIKTYPKVATALILPSAQSRYEDLIQLMDTVKRGSISQVGIAPL